jgi:hypothetical protein
MVSRYFKRILAAAVLFLAAVGQNVGAVAFCNPLSGDCTGANGKGLDALITGIMNFLFGLALVVCPALMVWGGFLIATAAGEEAKVKSGRQIITYSIIGLVVIALSNVIKAVILDIANS